MSNKWLKDEQSGRSASGATSLGEFHRLLGLKLKQLRKKLRITQVEAAAGLGMNYRHYQDIEAGKSDIKMSSLLKISAFFKVSMDELMTVDPAMVSKGLISQVERAFRDVADYFPSGAVLRDMEGRIVTVNHASANLGDRSKEELEGVHVVDIAPPEMRDIYSLCLERERRGSFEPIVYKWVNKDQSIGVINYYPFPIIGPNGKPQGVVALTLPRALPPVQDFSNQRRA